MENRRNFLKTAGLLTAGAIIAPGFACKPKSGAVSETIAVSGNKNIGIQIYTLRDQIAVSLEKTMAGVAEIGYKWIEAYGYENRKILGKSPKEFNELLSGLGMTMPSIHSVTEVSSSAGKSSILDAMKIAVEDAKLAGAKYFVYAFLKEEERRSMDDYKRHAATFNSFGEICKDAGIQFAYHNHDFEFIEFDGQMPYDYLLNNTDPELVKMELDLYWITKGGQDPVEYFKKAPGRFPLWHVKDMEEGPEKFFAEVGYGTMDFESIFAAKETADLKYIFVEQDRSRRDPMESIRMSWEFLNKASYV
ncbi:MAG: TIM barrel protein [Bacteroidales bacterium]|nr:TIM barrel protein [Bacteroidales bacterium]MCF8390702.1 TIM barrel protein [Bacteroidales bacterium]